MHCSKLFENGVLDIQVENWGNFIIQAESPIPALLSLTWSSQNKCSGILTKIYIVGKFVRHFKQENACKTHAKQNKYSTNK